jgi:hypothetical protein
MIAAAAAICRRFRDFGWLEARDRVPTPYQCNVDTHALEVSSELLVGHLIVGGELLDESLDLAIAHFDS